MKPYYQDDYVTLYHGDCREILPGLGQFDAVITDPPYSEKTHAGHDAIAKGNSSEGKDGSRRESLGYAALSPNDCVVLSGIFAACTQGWICWMTDHVLAPHIDSSLRKENRYVFAPLPFFAPGSRVRLSGDGPSSWTDWIIVARTAALSKWGTLPGGYVAAPGWNDKIKMGGKPTALMASLIRDYTREGAVIVDPFAGSGSTLRAAKDLGRKSVGIEINEADCEIAARRMAQEVLAFE